MVAYMAVIVLLFVFFHKIDKEAAFPHSMEYSADIYVEYDVLKKLREKYDRRSYVHAKNTKGIVPELERKAIVNSSSDKGFGSELEIRLRRATEDMVKGLTKGIQEQYWENPSISKIMDFLVSTHSERTYFSDILPGSLKGWYTTSRDDINISRFQPDSAKPYVNTHEQQHRINAHYGLPQDENLVDQASRYRVGNAYPDRFQNRTDSARLRYQPEYTPLR
jgi:hypothetical protein